MLKKLLIVIAVLAVLLMVVIVLAYTTTENFSQFGASPTGERLARIQKSPLFDGKQFRNPEGWGEEHMGMSFGMFTRWFFGQEVREPEHALPVVSLDRNSFTDKPEPGLRVTWLGHSTAILEIDNRRILFDPVWSERCSPSTIMGPERFFPVPLRIEDLPPLDAVMISHDHFDHLDMHAIQYLKDTGVKFITALGVGAHLEYWGVDPEQIVELEWWQMTDKMPGLMVIATPARHFSGRNPMKANESLWVSFALVGPYHRVFFSGDSGPFPDFAEIGGKYGPFDLTMMKVGAYSDDWPAIHLNPEQAMEAHRALNGRVFLPVHWGTFNLAYHRWDEPIERALKAAEENAVTIIAPMPGQTVDIEHPPSVETWWRAK
ncbi:MBL fold metallo-hydrolase [bacterium]|nr:MBL fold metallo-hydrolase [bacterium]